MKHLAHSFILLVGIAMGAAVVLFWNLLNRPEGIDRSERVTRTTTIANGLETQLAESRAEIASLKQQIASLNEAEKKRAETGEFTLPGGGKGRVISSMTVGGINADGGDLDMAKFEEKIQEEMKIREEKKIETRLATLRTRLNLTEDQETSLRPLLEKALETPGLELEKSILKAAKAGEPSRSEQFNNDLAAMLDDDQMEAYTEYLDDRFRSKIEAKTNRELAGIQEMMTLSEDQTDAIFEALSGVISEESEASPFGDEQVIDFGALAGRQEARLDLLKPILSDEQLDLYEAQASQASSLFPGMEEVTGAMEVVVREIGDGTVVGGLIKETGGGPASGTSVSGSESGQE